MLQRGGGLRARADFPGGHPHSNSQPDGAVVYVEQPGKYDNHLAGK